MRAELMGFTDRNDSLPTRGARVAAYVEEYMQAHRGLSVGELAFRLRVDKRDLRRLLNDKSCGSRLEDALAAYFGPDFVDQVFRHLWPDGRSIREKELDRERAEIAARRERLECDRASRRLAGPQDRAAVRLVDGGDRKSVV